MDSSTWYRQLIKPSWAPPAWLFGPVWTVLYTVIAASFGYVVYMFAKGKISWFILLPFLLNVVVNLAFTPFQFGLRSNLLAAVDILLVFGSIIWFMLAIWPYAHWVALVNIPYLIWVSFATILQLTITVKNL